MSKPRSELPYQSNALSACPGAREVTNKLLEINAEGDPSFKKINELVNYSHTSKAINSLFKPNLDECKAVKLISYILIAGQSSINKILDAARVNPEIFFVKVTVRGACDLDGNYITLKNWSPYQALFGTQNIHLLSCVKPILNLYLKTLENGFEFSENHVREKFPNGFDFPKSVYPFHSIAETIMADSELQNTGKPNKATQACLSKFKCDFKPGEIEFGHFFNMNDFINALSVLHGMNYHSRYKHNRNFFKVKFIGFLERFMQWPYLQIAAHGFRLLEKDTDNFVPKKLSYKVDVFDCIAKDKEKFNKDKRFHQYTVHLFDYYPSCRLGEDFALNCTYDRQVGVRYFRATDIPFEEVIKQNISALLTMKEFSKSEEPSPRTCVIL